MPEKQRKTGTPGAELQGNHGCYPGVGDLVNRFFRSALFPLIVIVLLVYLASQTLMRGVDKAPRRLDLRG